MQIGGNIGCLLVVQACEDIRSGCLCGYWNLRAASSGRAGIIIGSLTPIKRAGARMSVAVLSRGATEHSVLDYLRFHPAWQRPVSSKGKVGRGDEHKQVKKQHGSL